MRQVLTVLVSYFLVHAIACSKPSNQQDHANKPSQSNQEKPITSATQPDTSNTSWGLRFTLEPGLATTGIENATPYDPGVSLSEVETQQLLKRLPVKEKMVLKKDFALRDKSLPPPLTGARIQDAWPPPATPPVPDTGDPGKLEVVRTSPPQDVYIAPNISVTFSQPMVAVTSHADTIALGVPMQIQPEIKGKWRWLGTRTLVFESELERLPKSTQYTVTVKSGIQSAVGKKLENDVSWSFSTPTVQVEEFYPQGGPQKLDPVFFVRMDQRIDPAAVLAVMEMQSNTSINVPLRFANENEINRDVVVANKVKIAQKEFAGRYFAFVPVQKLSPGTTYTVRFGPGVPSLEGPNKTQDGIVFSLRTYDPLIIQDQNCESQNQACRPPYQTMYLQFNNPLDEDKFQDAWVHVEPTLPDMRIMVQGSNLLIKGKIQGRRNYKVRISGDLVDMYGQTLGTDTQRTFYYREATPALMHNYQAITVADPLAPAELRFNSVNIPELTVHIYQTAPQDISAYIDYARRYRWDKKVTPPGKLVHEEKLKFDTQNDAAVETVFPLQKFLSTKSHGNLMVVVSQPTIPKNRYKWHTFSTWITFTDLAIDAHMDYRHLYAMVTRLSDGKPVTGAIVHILGTGVSAKTDIHGLVKLDLLTGSLPDTAGILTATLEDDVVLLPRDSYLSYRRMYTAEPGPGKAHRFFTFDDHKLYKPKETVSIKGYLRLVDMGPTALLSLPDTGIQEISWTAFDARNNKMAQGRAPINTLGGFHFSFSIPDNANLGWGRIELTCADAHHSHFFQIAEFRKPEFEVNISASPGPLVLGDQENLTLTAAYFSGGGLPGAEVTWNVNASTTSYSPPNTLDWSFGDQSMRWWFLNEDNKDTSGSTQHHSNPQTLAGTTNSRGQHSVRLTFLDANPSVPYSVTAYATVIDVNRQSWTANTTFLVHPSSLYVGLRTQKYFVPTGQPMRVEAIVTDIDGKRVLGVPIQITAQRDHWEYQRGKLRRIKGNAKTCTLTSTVDQPPTCDLQLEKGGSYTITAEIKDNANRKNLTRITRYVEGGELPVVRKVDRERVHLVADKTEYQPGEKARIFVQAPFYPAHGIWFLRHAGMDTPHPFTLDGPTTVLEILLSEVHMPGTEVQVEITGATHRVDDAGRPLPNAPKRPAYAGGVILLPVSLAQRVLSVQLTPQTAQLTPGGSTTVQILVNDAQGKPVANSEVAVVAVDEAVLALIGYRLPNPIHTFYPSRAGYTFHRWLREYLRLSTPRELDKSAIMDEGAARPMDVSVKSAAVMAVPGAGPPPASIGAKKMKYADDTTDVREETTKGRSPADASTAPVAVRSNFSALALFAPEVQTDAAGRAQVKLKLPDNLTRYRLMAITVSGPTHYGIGENTVTARLPLQLRPSPPRFLNFGDHFDLSLVVFNQTEQPQTVQVAVRGENIVWKGPQGKKVNIPANDRREVRFAAAADAPGTAHIDAIAISANKADAASFELPVWTPATTEGFATYGTIDDQAIVQPVAAPTNVVPNFGSLDVQTSSTQLQALTDAVLYLYSYPYECSEQLSSRILSIAALRDVLSSFEAAGLPPQERIQEAIQRDLQKLSAMQNTDGGFPFWIRGQKSWPFLTVHVTHALLRTKEKGYAVPERMLAQALSYLKTIEKRIPSIYPEWVKHNITAYSLYVRHLAKDSDVNKATQLYTYFASEKEPNLEGIGWLYPLFVTANKQDTLQAIRKLLLSRVSETAGTATFVTYASDGAHLILYSNRRVDALLLSGFMQDQPQSDLIPKIVAGLLANRQQGRWANTQESVWVLLAMDEYFQKYEKITPNFVSRIWLGQRFAGEHRFAGRTTKHHVISIPMQALGAPGTRQDLLLAKDGAGRLYYRIGLTYALSDLRPPPAEHGFSVMRRYEGIEKPDDVRRDADGTWRVRAKARVKVTLTMLAPSRRYHVALVDPLPAGFEPENAMLRGAFPPSNTTGSDNVPIVATSQRSHHAPSMRWVGWWGVWYEHHNIRDERIEAFTSLLDAGVHEFVYTARATTPGTFVVPPLKAEEMYAPETFGRSAGDRVIVEP